MQRTVQPTIDYFAPKSSTHRSRAYWYRDLEWGFTIVRRRDPDEESRSSVFEYLAPVKFDGAQSGEVLSFPADRYPIFPDRNGPYNRMAEYGSLIKLYEYRWQGTTSSIIMPSDGAGLIRRIEIALAEPALPFKLYECRGYQSNENFRSARGILTDLDRNPGDLEAGFPQSVDSGHRKTPRHVAYLCLQARRL